MSESEKSDIQEDKSPTVAESLNNATDHYHKIMGMPNKRADLNAMPRWLKFFYYFIVCIIAIGFLIGLYASIFK
ncbi:hypothetical protein [Paenibacillus terrigena]|uniref:hypothetical protein n=1 Tax=Paenibacillus terrigena TaxID=369333 RepID=UPI0028D24BA0|nr:hypothetical protein [Paenibacillus terrigena]